MTTTLDTSATPELPVAPPGIAAMPRQLVLSLLWDIGPSVAAYYGARALGCTEYVSLLAGNGRGRGAAGLGGRAGPPP